MKLLMAQEVILRLDEAQDSRPLSPAEHNLRHKLKKRILGWLVVEKARKRQTARISCIKEGDANTRFFHLRANGRRRKNFIQRLGMDMGGYLNTTISNNSSRNTLIESCASRHHVVRTSPGSFFRPPRWTCLP
jgi:hypothetical protein